MSRVSTLCFSGQSSLRKKLHRRSIGDKLKERPVSSPQGDTESHSNRLESFVPYLTDKHAPACTQYLPEHIFV